MLEKTIDESDELIRTFNALLSIARLEAGGNSQNFAQNDLQEIIGDVAELYEPLSEEKHMTLIVRDGPALRVMIDRQLLGQAVANLVDNAIKYGGSEPVLQQNSTNLVANSRGSIVLEAGICDADETGNEQKSVFISVSDRGYGIAPSEISNAMKRFGRLEKSRSKPGTGLGLSLVSAVAKLHGGTLRLEDNEPGLVGKIVIPYNTMGTS